MPCKYPEGSEHVFHKGTCFVCGEKETDMEVKELVELLSDYALRKGQVVYALIYSTGSTYLASRRGTFKETFQNIEELEQFLKEKQKPLDYKSLFSVVDGRLVANFSKIKITEENAPVITSAKWKFRGEQMNELGRIITSKTESDTCAYCYLYLKEGCVKCPIYNVTGKELCNGTPFEEFIDANYDEDLFAVMKANERMEEFLKSLMEK